MDGKTKPQKQPAQKELTPEDNKNISIFMLSLTAFFILITGILSSCDSGQKDASPAPTPTTTVTATVTQTPTVTATPEPETKPPAPAPAPVDEQPKQQPEEAQNSQERTFRNCKEAKAAGAAPLYRGQPGYSPKLDRDGDGVACER